MLASGQAVLDELGLTETDRLKPVIASTQFIGGNEYSLVFNTVVPPGPFFPGATSTYDVVFDKDGESVDIKAP